MGNVTTWWSFCECRSLTKEEWMAGVVVVCEVLGNRAVRGSTGTGAVPKSRKSIGQLVKWDLSVGPPT